MDFHFHFKAHLNFRSLPFQWHIKPKYQGMWVVLRTRLDMLIVGATLKRWVFYLVTLMSRILVIHLEYESYLC